MARVPHLAVLGSLLAALVACSGDSKTPSASASGAPHEPVNVVFILADDLGWADVGFQGSTFHRTPHIDALARRGFTFTNAYAASPVCSPTRASLLTGKHPARLQLTKALRPELMNPQAPLGPVTDGPADRRMWDPVIRDRLPLEETTFAERLQAAGYRTGYVGKWHLGESLPHEHGFDAFVAADPLGVPRSYFSPYGIPTLTDGPEGEYLTDRLTDEAIGFLRQARDEPFFLFLSHFAPHAPWEAKPELVADYETRVDPDAPQRNPVYAAMIHSLDESVGRVVAALEELGLAETTAVVFASDNGALEDRVIRRHSEEHRYEYHVTSNLPLRGDKGKLYEGGLRVPLVVDWPGVTRAGASTDVPVVSMDLYPTFLALAGVEPATAVDGHDLTPLLRGGPGPERTALHFHLPHQIMACAMRRGRHKLVHFFGGATELYDLAADVGETRDLAAEEPRLAEELRSELFAWLDEVGAARPTPNPDWVPPEDG